jgi:hypothetical protein
LLIGLLTLGAAMLVFGLLAALLDLVGLDAPFEAADLSNLFRRLWRRGDERSRDA